MDRSFLSDPSVIAASRAFVCIRLTTYEDEAEMAFLKKLYTGRSGEVENTTLTVLSPDLKPLTRISRGAAQIFGTAERMTADLERLGQQYTKSETRVPALPITLSPKLGLNVAASEGQLLIVVLATDGKKRTELEQTLATLAWSPQFLGHFTYAVGRANELKNVPGLPADDGIVVIEPDAFGLKGTVRQTWQPKDGDAALVAQLRSALKYQPPAKALQTHRRQGTRQGAFWETKLTVTDPEEANARARTRRQMANPPP